MLVVFPAVSRSSLSSWTVRLAVCTCPSLMALCLPLLQAQVPVIPVASNNKQSSEKRTGRLATSPRKICWNLLKTCPPFFSDVVG